MYLFSIIEALLITLALSIDTFVASFSYGTGKIKIPFTSVLVIDGICSISVGLAMVIGLLLKNLIPASVTVALCFSTLFLIGLCKLLDGITKSFIQKHGAISSNIKFAAFNFRFVLNVYANPEWADVDQSKTISPKEAVALSVALSLDGCAAGLGTALGNSNGLFIFLFSLPIQALAVIFGSWLGNRVAKKLKFNISWIGGIILILLAFIKL